MPLNNEEIQTWRVWDKPEDWDSDAVWEQLRGLADTATTKADREWTQRIAPLLMAAADAAYDLGLHDAAAGKRLQDEIEALQLCIQGLAHTESK